MSPDRASAAIGRRNSDRRIGPDRRASLRQLALGPSWNEQRAQFITRYLFWGLGLAYFNFNPGGLVLPGIELVNAVFLLYGIGNALFMLHARHRPQAPFRWRMAMYTDILFVSFCFAADRSAVVPPAFMAYLAVILGNGMRYNIDLFREAVIASFATCLVALYVRYNENFGPVNSGTAFVMLFGAIIVLYSYSLMKRIEEGRAQLEREGRIDPLTGLLNRRGLHEKADVLFAMLERNNRPLAVVFADLNKFKAVNDRLGHNEGDRVLTQVANVLSSSVRSSDILARYGGDEFLLILPESDLVRAGMLAERIQANMAHWARASGVDLGMTIGVGEAPRHGGDLTTVLSAVDKAMYRGKGSTRQIEYAEELMPPALAESGAN